MTKTEYKEPRWITNKGTLLSGAEHMMHVTDDGVVFGGVFERRYTLPKFEAWTVLASVGTKTGDQLDPLKDWVVSNYFTWLANR